MDSLASHSIDDVVAVLSDARTHGRSAALLIGAGCSVSAGIPLASGFVEMIRQDFALAYDRAEEKTYAHCMAQLTYQQRHDLISTFIREARINWAHLAIAQLMLAGYVDRVLTVNFDPLLVRACALIGLFPGVYDLATTEDFQPARVAEVAVFHLHGQQSGFVQLHTQAEIDAHSKRLAPVFTSVGANRVWIVAGYSGDNDPVFDQLADVQFDNRLYWVGHLASDPAPHVRQRLLEADKDAVFVRGFDADRFVGDHLNSP